MLTYRKMPRDVGPATTYKSTDVESIADDASDKGTDVESTVNDSSEEKEHPPKSEIVRRLETIVELSDSRSSSDTSETKPDQL
jgi:hypothetical protein